MSKFSRTASKYKHTQGAPMKRELWYPDIKVSNSAGDYNSIAVSASWIAFSSGTAGSIGLIDVNETGKRKGDLVTIHAHGNDITDLQFSPFDDSLLASASDDASIKIWAIPENNKENISSAKTVLNGHKRRVESIKFHPSAANVLASTSGDKTVKIWNLETGKDEISLEGLHDDVVHCVAWNNEGNLIATHSKDGKIRIIDPRTKSVLQTGEGHKGVKASRIVWLSNINRIATTGFSKTRERQFALWDASDLSKPLVMTTLDSSTGVLDLHYDLDTSLLFLAGKGDGGIRMFEMYDSAPHYQELSAVQGDAQKSSAVFPKRSLDLMNTEVSRVFKLTPANIIPVSYTVPRKSKAEFQEDLYPPTASNEFSLTSSEWFGGETRAPKLVQLTAVNKDKFWISDSDVKQQENSSNSNNNNYSSTTTTTTITTSTPEPVEVTHSAAHVDYGARKASVSTKTTSSVTSSLANTSLSGSAESRARAASNIVRSSKFRHIAGKGTKPEACYTNLQTNLSAPNNSFIKANSSFFAVPWRGTGGQVAIIPFARTGRQADKVGVIECGSECLDFDFNPFNDNMIATVTENAHLQIWNIPQGGLSTVQRNPDATLKGHNRRVTSVDFHPLASDVIATSAGDWTVRLWDLKTESEKIKLEDHEDAIMSVTWDYRANLLATSSKDRYLRIFDPRNNSKLVKKTLAHDGAKGFKAVWLGNKDQILTVGHSKSSVRQISLWDTRNFETSLYTVDIDQQAGVITPNYDPDTGVVYLAGKGDGNLKMYEVNDEKPYIHFLTEHRTNVPAHGVAALPKSMVNVKDCEIATFLKLCGDYAEQLHFTVPRTKMEFFQDDLFPLTRKVNEPSLTSAEWFGGQTRDPKLYNLQPQGMTPLSQAPKEEKGKKYDFASEVAKENNRFSKDKFLDTYYKQVGVLSERENQVLKQDLMEGTDDSEWD